MRHHKYLEDIGCIVTSGVIPHSEEPLKKKVKDFIRIHNKEYFTEGDFKEDFTEFVGDLKTGKFFKDIFKTIKYNIDELISYNKYGIHEAETYSFDYTLAVYLYEHLMHYKKYARKIVDLNNPLQKFTIEICSQQIDPWKSGFSNLKEVVDYFKQHNKINKLRKVKVTEEKAIDIVLSYLKNYLTYDDKFFDSITTEEVTDEDTIISTLLDADALERYQAAINIISVIVPSLWT